MNAVVVNAEFRTEGICRTRVYFDAFVKKDYCPLAMEQDTGIRCHSWLTALFLRCFRCIVDIKLENGKVLYLNKADFERWKTTHLDVLHNEDTNEACINATCAVKYARIATDLLDNYRATCPGKYAQTATNLDNEREPAAHRNMRKAVELLEKAAKINCRGKDYFTQRLSINRELTDAFIAGQFSDPEQSIRSFHTRITEVKITHSKRQSMTSQILDHAQEKIELLERIDRIFQKALKGLCYPQELNQILEKELAGKLNFRMPDSLIEDELNDGKRDAFLKSIDHWQDLPEANGNHTLVQKHHMTRLDKAVTFFTPEIIDQIYQQGLSADQKEIQAQVKEFESKASWNVQQKLFSTAVERLRDAEKLSFDESDKKSFQARIEKLEVFNKWLTAHPKASENHIGASKAILNIDLKNDLFQWQNAPNAAKTQSAKKVVEISKAVASAFHKFLESKDSYARSYQEMQRDLAPHAQLLQALGVDVKTLENDELAKISATWTEESRDTLESLQKFETVSRINECYKNLQKSFADYVKAEESNDSADLILKDAVGEKIVENLRVACLGYQAAENAAPEALKGQYGIKQVKIQELQEWVKEHAPTEEQVQAQEKEIAGKIALFRDIEFNDGVRLGIVPFEQIRAIQEKIKTLCFRPLHSNYDGLYINPAEQFKLPKNLLEILPKASPLIERQKRFNYLNLYLSEYDTVYKEAVKLKGQITKAVTHTDNVFQFLNAGDLENAQKTLRAIQAEMKESCTQGYYAELERSISYIVEFRGALASYNADVYQNVLEFIKLSEAERKKEVEKAREELRQLRERHDFSGAKFTGTREDFEYEMRLVSGEIDNIIETFRGKFDARFFLDLPIWKRVNNENNDAKFSLSTLCSFDFVTWRVLYHRLLSNPYKLPVPLQKVYDDYAFAYNFIQFKRCVKAFFDERPARVQAVGPFFPVTDAFQSLEQDNKSNDSRVTAYAFNRNSVVQGLKFLKQALHDELNDHLLGNSRVHFKQRDNLIDQLLATAQHLGLHFHGMANGATQFKKEPPELMDPPKCRIPEGAYQAFLTAWEQWDKLDEKAKNAPAAFNALCNTVYKFVLMWKDVTDVCK